MKVQIWRPMLDANQEVRWQQFDDLGGQLAHTSSGTRSNILSLENLGME
jgi:hypothetical protein